MSSYSIWYAEKSKLGSNNKSANIGRADNRYLFKKIYEHYDSYYDL